MSTSSHHPVEVPAVGDTLELMLACILEGESASRDQILHGLGHGDLAGASQGADSSADVDGDATDVVAQ